MKSLEQRLDPAQFVRVQRSAIVPLHDVQELHPLPSGDYEIVLQSGRKVIMSRTYRDTVLARLQESGGSSSLQ
jgi:two-component system LytT family response regulator